MLFFFFKQKTAYELRISDWSSDVCSSDLFLDQVEELQPAIGVFLGDRDDEAQVGLDHFLLGAARLLLALLHGADDAAELDQRHARLGRDAADLGTQRLDLLAVLLGELLPAALAQPIEALDRKSTRLNSSP